MRTYAFGVFLRCKLRCSTPYLLQVRLTPLLTCVSNCTQTRKFSICLRGGNRIFFGFGRKGIEKRLEISGESAGKLVAVAEEAKRELVSMEEMARKFLRYASFDVAGSIEGIADYRMTEGGKVNADLVHAAGFWFGFDEIIAVEVLENAVFGEGFASGAASRVLVIGNGLFAQALGAGDGLVDNALSGMEVAIDKGEIGFGDESLGEKHFERFKSFLGFGDYQKAGSIFV